MKIVINYPIKKKTNLFKFPFYLGTISSDNQLETVKKLIFYGVRKGKIIENYTLLTQQLIEPQNSRNPRACPGKALSEELSKWPHFPKLQSES